MLNNRTDDLLALFLLIGQIGAILSVVVGDYIIASAVRISAILKHFTLCLYARQPAWLDHALSVMTESKSRRCASVCISAITSYGLDAPIFALIWGSVGALRLVCLVRQWLLCTVLIVGDNTRRSRLCRCKSPLRHSRIGAVLYGQLA